MGQLKNFRTDVLRILEAAGWTGVTRATHYARNDDQADIKTYFDVITARAEGGWNAGFKYKMLPGYKSALHQFEDGSRYTDAYNTKWVSASDETEEYVFKYVGSDLNGQFSFLSDDRDIAANNVDVWVTDRNQGSYNFRPSGDVTGHLALDILPWILWGNNANDALRWSADDRLVAFKASLGLGAYAWTGAVLAAMVEDPYDDAGRLTTHLGSMGWDRFVGTQRQDYFVGRGGVDTVDYSASARAVTVSLERAPKDGQGFDGWAAGDLFTGIENLIGTDYGDILIGNGSDNRLMGGGGRDILSGKGGNDILDGGSGENTIFGNAGDDRIFVHDVHTEVDGGRGFDTIVTTLRNFYTDNLGKYENVEAFQLINTGPLAASAQTLTGSAADEALIGNDYANQISGWGGNDYLEGRGGNDVLSGGKGNDTYVFKPGWGHDYIYEDGGWDSLHFVNTDLADLRLDRAIGVNSGTLEIWDRSGENFVSVFNNFSSTTTRVEHLKARDGVLDLRGGLPLTGTDQGDDILGTEFDDTIRGGAGNDTIYANDGDNTIIGGADNDYFWGGPGADHFIFEAGFGNDVLRPSATYPDEPDSDGDVIELRGVDRAFVSATVQPSTGHMTIETTSGDTIWILFQANTLFDGRLIETIRFDDGFEMPLVAFEAGLPF